MVEIGKHHNSGLCLLRAGCSSLSAYHFLEPFPGRHSHWSRGDASLQGPEGCSRGELSTYCMLGVVLAILGGRVHRKSREDMVMVADRLGRVQRASWGHPPCLTLLLQMRMLGFRGADPHFPGHSSWIGARPLVLSPTWPKASGSLSQSGGHGQGGLQQRGLLGPPEAELGRKQDRVFFAKNIASCPGLRAGLEARQRGPCA